MIRSCTQRVLRQVTSTSKHQQQTNYHRHHGGATATAGAKRMLTTSGNNKNDDDPTTPPKKNEGLILPERGVAELLGSSIQGLFSFLDADSRDKFIERANSNIINPSALGIPVSLALHHELECVLWDKYKFDVMEFGNGVGHALEYYHDMDAKFHEEINQQVSKVTKMDMSAFQTQPPPEKQEADKDENNDNIDNHKKIDNIDNNNDSNIKLSFPKPMTEKPLKFLEVVTQLAKDLKTFADDHPESAAAKIQSLTTPFLFEMQCFASAQGHLLFKMGAMDKAMPEVWKHKVVIENVTLLSARARAVEPEPATIEEISKMNDADKERNDDLINNIYHEYPCVAQIEVLYNYKYDTNPTETNTSSTSSTTTTTKEEDNDKSSTTSSTSASNDDVKKDSELFQFDATSKQQQQQVNLMDILSKQRSIRVTFTGWLLGSPEGKGLDWKIGALAPAHPL